MDLAKRLISVAAIAGCDAVKFQKRTVDVVYSAEELAKPRESPFGTTNGELKRALEFSVTDYEEIDSYCEALGIRWFASCWDEQSLEAMRSFALPCFKIASPTLTDDRLLEKTRALGKPIILSTGMSTLAEIDHAVEVLGKEDLILLHACSAYPASYEQLNLRVIPQLRERYGVLVGYSGHETGIPSSVAAVVLGACCVERHITLDRAMWGTDQAASLEPNGITRLVRDIRLIEKSLGDGVKRVYDSEMPALQKLRRVGHSAVTV
jgi:N-acetylneuraminate synthase